MKVAIQNSPDRGAWDDLKRELALEYVGTTIKFQI